MRSTPGTTTSAEATRSAPGTLGTLGRSAATGNDQWRVFGIDNKETGPACFTFAYLPDQETQNLATLQSEIAHHACSLATGLRESPPACSIPKSHDFSYPHPRAASVL